MTPGIAWVWCSATASTIMSEVRAKAGREPVPEVAHAVARGSVNPDETRAGIIRAVGPVASLVMYPASDRGAPNATGSSPKFRPTSSG